jgi:hypothetical protein
MRILCETSKHFGHRRRIRSVCSIFGFSLGSGFSFPGCQCSRFAGDSHCVQTMAPKSRKRAASAAPKPSETTGPPPSTLVGKSEQEQAASKRRQLERRSSDAQIDRSIEEHFAHLTPYQKVTMQVDDKTLREHIHAARVNMRSGQRLGPSFWRDLAIKFIALTDPVASLEPSNHDLPISERLCAAVDALHHRNPAARSTEPMVAWLRHVQEVNELEFLGVLNACIAPLQVQKSKVDVLIVEIMKLMTRLDLHLRWPHFVRAAKGHFDLALSSHFSRLKHSGVTLATFMDCYRKEVGLVMDASDADVVMSCKTSWDKVSSQTSRLVTGSMLGKAMFGFAQVHVDAATFATRVEEVVDGLGEVAGITAKDLPAYHAQCADLMAQCCSLGSMKREIKLKYGPAVVSLTVQELSTEVELRLVARLKSDSLGFESGLKLLPWERWMFKLHPAGTACPVEAGLLVEMNAARSMALELVKLSENSDMSSLRAAYNKKSAEFLSIDPSFKLELAFLATKAPEVVDEYVRRMVLDALPDGDAHPPTLSQALSSLLQLQDLDVFKYSSGLAHDQVRSVSGILQNMKKNVSPKFEDSALKQEGGFFNSVAVKLPNFLCCPDPKDDEKKKLVFGKVALGMKFEEMTIKMSGKQVGKVLLNDLEVFQTYRWLLDATMVQTLSGWVASVLKLNLQVTAGEKAGTAILDGLDKSSGASSSSSGPAAGKQTAAGKKAAPSKTKGAASSSQPDTTSANIMRFFKTKHVASL